MRFNLSDTKHVLTRGKMVSNSRGSKVKSRNQKLEGDVFWMNLEEAKQAIADKYEYLGDRYEVKTPKKPI